MDSKVASVKAFEVAVQFFQEDGWKFARRDERMVLQSIAGGKNGNFACFFDVKEEHPLVLFYCVAGFRVPEEKRSALAEFITRANYGLCVGNFEMDYSDGEVRYKTSMDLRDGELTEDMVKALVLANLMTMDRYVAGTI